jgi:hypothetical protein
MKFTLNLFVTQIHKLEYNYIIGWRVEGRKTVTTIHAQLPQAIYLCSHKIIKVSMLSFCRWKRLKFHTETFKLYSINTHRTKVLWVSFTNWKEEIPLIEKNVNI